LVYAAKHWTRLSTCTSPPRPADPAPPGSAKARGNLERDTVSGSFRTGAPRRRRWCPPFAESWSPFHGRSLLPRLPHARARHRPSQCCRAVAPRPGPASLQKSSARRARPAGTALVTHEFMK
jgi:hypothetical protein